MRPSRFLCGAVGGNRPPSAPPPPAAAYFFSPDRSGVLQQAFLATFTGIFQADAFSGFGRLYEPGREGGDIVKAAC